MLNVNNLVQIMEPVLDTTLTIMRTNVGFMKIRTILTQTPRQMPMVSTSTGKCLV